jgi:hypothetical protein
LTPDFGGGRDELSGYPVTFAGLVPRDVVDDDTDERASAARREL